jgi:rhodanese-related sulfurtransferase
MEGRHRLDGGAVEADRMNVPWWWPFGDVEHVAPEALAEALGRKPWPQLLDVRTAAEFSAGHIRGATNVPITSLQARIPTLDLDRSRLVVAVCLSAHRSPPAVRLLRRRGYEAAELAGGMMAWRAAGLPLARR